MDAVATGVISVEGESARPKGSCAIVRRLGVGAMLTTPFRTDVDAPGS